VTFSDTALADFFEKGFESIHAAKLQNRPETTYEAQPSFRKSCAFPVILPMLSFSASL
jgi:hypothetical protein